MEIIIGALIFLAGYLTCFFTAQKQSPKDIITEVRRVKPNLRNPLKPFRVEYEKYKSRDNGLYEPQVPKRGDE